MDSYSRKDKLPLFRQAATALSAGILLIIIGSPKEVTYIGILFSLISVFILVAAFSQVNQKWHQFADKVKEFNDNLSIAFILISLISIIKNWVTIMNSVYNTNPNQKVPFVESIGAYSILGWVILFALGIILVSIVDLARGTRLSFRNVGLKPTFFRLTLTICLTLACWGFAVNMFRLTTGTVNLVIFIISTIFILIVLKYDLVKKRRAKRALLSSLKTQAQISAADLVIMANAIVDDLKLDYQGKVQKAIMNDPSNRIENDIQNLKAYMDTLK